MITHPITIDGFTQANIAVPYRYPNQVTSAVQDLIIGGSPTGGTFTPVHAGAAAGRHNAAHSVLGDARPKSSRRWI